MGDSRPLGRSAMWLCPACGAMMYSARLLKGYDKTGKDANRPTCALHGPRGPFHHIGTDRQPTSRGRNIR